MFGAWPRVLALVSAQDGCKRGTQGLRFDGNPLLFRFQSPSSIRAWRYVSINHNQTRLKLHIANGCCLVVLDVGNFLQHNLQGALERP